METWLDSHRSILSENEIIAKAKTNKKKVPLPRGLHI